MGCRVHVITESWLNFGCDCFCTMFYCPEKLIMSPYPLNIMFNDYYYYFRTGESDLLINLCKFQEKKRNQGLYFPDWQFVRAQTCIPDHHYFSIRVLLNILFFITFLWVLLLVVWWERTLQNLLKLGKGWILLIHYHVSYHFDLP